MNKFFSVLKVTGSAIISLALLGVFGFFAITNIQSFLGGSNPFVGSSSCTADFVDGKYGEGEQAVNELKHQCPNLSYEEARNSVNDYYNRSGSYTQCESCGKNSWASLEIIQTSLKRYW